MLTLIEAARHAKMSKSALHRAIQRGHVSVSRTETGSIRIDPSELARFASSRSSPPSHPRREPSRRNGTDDPKVWDPARDAVVAALDREIGVLRQVIDDLRVERDRWAQQAEKLLLVAPSRGRPRWWSWRRL